MATTRDFILTIDRDPQAAQRLIQKIADDLQTKKTPLVDVVQSLGEFINSEDSTVRAKAVKLLGLLIECLPNQFLSRQQISVLCDFLCDRIEDGNALAGLRVLSQSPRFTGDMAISSFRALCLNFPDLKARPQITRYEALTFLNSLMAHQRSSIRSLGLESLASILELVAGERDPRNLMIVFSFMTIVISEWDISSRIEEVFDSVFCYFPITFRPPPNDPYGITAQDLKDRLQSCLAASRLFAPYVFPQLIDKLDSTAINVKRDVLRAISACSASYGAATMSEYSISIWDSLKYEIFNAQEEELADEALSSLVTLAGCLDGRPEPHSSHSSFSTFLEPISKECNERLVEPQQKQAQPAARIIGAIAVTSSAALSILVQATLPPLLSLYQDAETFEMRRAVLSAVLTVLKAASQVGRGHAETPSSSPLIDFKEQLSEVLLQATMHTGSEVSFRRVGIESLTHFCLCPGLLDVSEVNQIGRQLCGIIIEANGATESIRSVATESISIISDYNPEMITEVVLPIIFSQLPDSTDDMEQPYRLLNALARLRLSSYLTGTLIRRLINKLLLVYQASTPGKLFSAIMATVNAIVLQLKTMTGPLLEFCSDNVSTLTQNLTQDIRATLPFSSLQLSAYAMLGRFSCLVLRALETDAQHNLSQQLIASLRIGDTTFANRDQGGVSDRSEISLILQTYLFAGLRSISSLPYSQQNLLELLDGTILRTRAPLEPLVRQHLLQQMALIVNKFMEPQKLFEVEDRLWNIEIGILAPKNLTKSSVRTGFWIIKALLLRVTNVFDTIVRLINLLSDEVHGAEVALGFEIILSPDEALSKENGAIIRAIAPQRIFSTYLAEIKTRLAKASQHERSNYLTALAGFVKYLNSDQITLQAETLVPLLSQSLALDNPKVQESAIRTLTVIVESSGESLDSHAPGLINRLLSSAVKQGANMIQVRHHSLIALQHFATRIKGPTLMPYRQAVINGIRPCLDDPKRYIRKDAVDCRSAWMSLDEVDGEAS